MAAGTRDLILEQGATYRFALQWLQPTTPQEPYDITGAEARMQVRTSAGELLIDLSTENGAIELDGPTGTVRIVLGAEETWKLNLKRAKYDVFLLLPGGDVTKLLKGRVLVDRAVTDYRDALSISPSGEPQLVARVVSTSDPLYSVTS